MNIYSDELIVSRTSGFVFKEMANESILIELVNNVVNMDKVITLNELGTFIYNQLQESKNIKQLVLAITSEFEIDIETATKDLNEFIAHAISSKILEIGKV